MAAGAEPGPLWKQAVAETLWGRRGVAKAVHCCMPLGVAASAGASFPPGRLWLVCLQVLFVSACWAQAAILANDLADRETDAAVGKRRWIWRLRRGSVALLVAVAVGAGVLVVLAADAGTGPLAAYCAAVVLALLYSIRPVRLKEKGLAGPFAYAAAAGLAYGVMPCAWLRAGWTVWAAVAPAVSLDKWVNLHFHQVIDYAGDRDRGTRTLVAAVGPDRAWGTLRWMAVLASAWLLGATTFAVLRLTTWQGIAVGCCAASGLAAAAYARAGRRRAGDEAGRLCELPLVYLASAVSVLRVLPLVLFVRLAVLDGSMWITAGMVASLVALDSWHMLRYRHE